MANHGVAVCGTTVAEAYDLLYYLERACQVQLLCHVDRPEIAPGAAGNRHPHTQSISGRMAELRQQADLAAPF